MLQTHNCWGTAAGCCDPDEAEAPSSAASNKLCKGPLSSLSSDVASQHTIRKQDGMTTDQAQTLFEHFESRCQSYGEIATAKATQWLGNQPLPDQYQPSHRSTSSTKKLQEWLGGPMCHCLNCLPIWPNCKTYQTQSEMIMKQ